MVGDTAGRSFTLHERLERDDHDNPSFYVREDGRLEAFWSRHEGDAIYHRVADSLDRWGPLRHGPENPGPGGYTYPTPIRAGHTLFLFWSGVGDSATYATSRDDGETWSEARSLFSPQYVRYIKYRAFGDEIHLAWNLVHPRVWPSGIYHAVIRPDGSITRQDGTPIGRLGTPLDPLSGDTVYSLAIDGGAWIHDLAVTSDGRPVIAYATFPVLTDHSYRYASYDGSWRDEQVTKAGPTFDQPGGEQEDHYSGGINLDKDDPTVVYLSRVVGGQHHVERWERRATGWVSAPITHDSTDPNVRPYAVGGGVFWMHGAYPGYRLFQTVIRWQPDVPPVPSPPAPGATATGSTPAPPTGPAGRQSKSARVLMKGARWRGGRVQVRLRCRRGPRCSGWVEALRGRRPIARRSYRLRSGEARWLTLRLTRYGSQVGARAPRFRVRLHEAARGGAAGAKAEGEGFEPSVQGLPTQRFSRPPDSTTLAPLRGRPGRGKKA